ncbi:MAG: PspC domain-containing protein [Deinococcales bacterium]
MASQSPKRLMRNRIDKRLAGVCGGLADYFGVNSALARLIFIASFFLTAGISLWLYLVLWIVLPQEPVGGSHYSASGTVINPLQRLNTLVAKSQVQMSPRLKEKVASIYGSMQSVLPKLEAANPRREPEMVALKEATLDYFPNVLENYLSLPKEYALSHRQSNGQTPEEQLLDDLELIDDSLKRVLERNYQSNVKGAGNIDILRQRFETDPVRDVRKSLEKLENRVAGRVSMTMSEKIGSIKNSILATLPQMIKNSSGMDQNIFNMRQTALEYLPDAVDKYLALPVDFAKTKILRNGKTAEDTLLEQLELLENTVEQLMTSFYQEDASGLLIHGRFLQEKFANERFELPSV